MKKENEIDYIKKRMLYDDNKRYYIPTANKNKAMILDS